MLVRFFFIVFLVTPSSGFFFASSKRGDLKNPRRSVVRAVSYNTPPVPIVVAGANLDITPALNEYVQSKVQKAALKHRAYVNKVDVVLTVNHNPRVKENHKAEVTMSVKGAILRHSEVSENMYASIDFVVDGLSRKLRKFKERRRDRKLSRHPLTDALEEDDQDEADLAEDEDFVDEYDADIPAVNLQVVKEKKFNMDPISLEDAVLCLDYIDHDFYVFRNAATNEVNVVYKRNHGGVGHIEPE